MCTCTEFIHLAFAFSLDIPPYLSTACWQVHSELSREPDMAIQIKSADAAAAKYAANGAAAGAAYKAGVMNPRTPWQAATEAAAPNYAAGVQASIGNGSFAKGVRAAGDSKWQRKAGDVGAQRFPSGVTAARADYQAGVAPYLAVISSLTLPPRGPKGDPGNITRVSTIAAALRAKKLAG